MIPTLLIQSFLVCSFKTSSGQINHARIKCTHCDQLFDKFCVLSNVLIFNFKMSSRVLFCKHRLTYYSAIIVELARLVMNWIFPFSCWENTRPPPQCKGTERAGYERVLCRRTTSRLRCSCSSQ